MRKPMLVFILLLTLTFAVGAHAEGILPVLQTPPPEIVETLSFHRAMNFSSTPSAYTTGDGRYYYEYSPVNYETYLDFGRALAQEGFTLGESGLRENGSSYAVLANESGTSMTVDYNAAYSKLTVTYAPRVLAWETDEDNPYVIDESLEPVLPELPHTISYHRAMNFGSTPSGSSTGDGGVCYSYDSVTYPQYLNFGRALAQEGFALAQIEQANDGTGAVTAACTQDGATLNIFFNDDEHRLKVTYAPGMLAAEVDSDDPYVIDESLDSILPELTQIVSLHSATGRGYDSVEFNYDQGGYTYYYSGVPYAAYARFSLELGEAGFSLVSSEKTEDGYDRAVVSNGEVELIIDYHQENKYARVVYPPYAHASSRALFDDYDLVSDGDTIEVMENVKLTFGGWKFVNEYYSYSDGTSYYVGDGQQIVLIEMAIDYYRPEAWDVGDLMKGRKIYIGRVPFDSISNFGEYRSDPDDPDVNDIFSAGNELSGKAQITAALAIRLTDEQAAHLEDLSVVFYSTDYTTPYVYRLKAQ